MRWYTMNSPQQNWVAARSFCLQLFFRAEKVTCTCVMNLRIFTHDWKHLMEIEKKSQIFDWNINNNWAITDFKKGEVWMFSFSLKSTQHVSYQAYILSVYRWKFQFVIWEIVKSVLVIFKLWYNLRIKACVDVM